MHIVPPSDTGILRMGPPRPVFGLVPRRHSVHQRPTGDGSGGLHLRLYHNVIWGKRKNNDGGLGIAPYVTDLPMYNNIILSVNLSHRGGAL